MKKRILTPIILLSSLFMVGTVAGCTNNTTSQQRAPMDLEGAGLPAANLGQDGDTYTDTTTGVQYTKVNGAWVINHSSVALSGEGEPNPTLGENGDTYTDTISGAEYIKQNGEWVLTKKGDVTYVVTFNLNGGKLANGESFIPNQIVREGRWVTEPAQNPVKDHCEFIGWFVEGTQTQWAFKGAQVYGDLNLVAHYSVNEDQKITYTVDPNNGEAKYTVDTFVGDYSFPSAPTKAGYDFQGWLKASTNTMYDGNVTAAMNGETIIAQWEKAAFNVSYQIEANGEATITGVLDINAQSITIPNTINGRKVTKISKVAFNNRISLLTVYIPENVKVIEEGAFAGARKLEKILVDSANVNYTSVDGVLFTKSLDTLVCYPTKSAVKAYTVPASVTRIASYAFYGTLDMGITSINFSEGLVEIGDYAFYMNETISSLTFPKTLRRIGKSAFVGNTYTQDGDDYASPQGILQTVRFNDGLEEIGDCAFANQYFKDTFELPSSIKVLAPYSFANCTAITKLVIPANLETFAPNAFNGCTGILEITTAPGCTNFVVQDKILYTSDMKTLVLCPSGRTEKVTVPEGVTAIGNYAFYMVDECQEYEFPSTLKTIGIEAFAQTYNLRGFTIPNSVESIGRDCFYESGIRTITIGTGLTAIPEGAFNATKISSVNIPGNVKTIEADAFGGSPLTTATLEEGVETIEHSAFSGCGSLATVSLPESLVTIGKSAFANTKVKTLYIGKNVTTIGDDVCYNYSSGTTSLESLTVSSENPNYAYQNNMLFTKDKTVLLFATKSIGTTVVIPEGVKKIGDYAFAKLTTITSYTFPSTLEEIGEGALTHCKIQDFTCPASLKKIGEGAFYFAYTKTVTFNDGLEEIGAYAFNMSDITSLSIPNSVKKIGDRAFYQTMALTTEINLGTGVEEIGEGAFMNSRISGTVTIPASVKTIGEGAFGCDISRYGPVIMSFAVDAANANYASDGSLLTNKAGDTVYGFASAKASLVIPEGVTTIANYGLSGSELSNVRTITLPNTLTTIGDYGIFGQTNVASISIPSSVTYVGSNAFGKWEAKQTVSFHCTRDYALVNFAPHYSTDCSAKITYLGE